MYSLQPLIRVDGLKTITTICLPSITCTMYHISLSELRHYSADLGAILWLLIATATYDCMCRTFPSACQPCRGRRRRRRGGRGLQGSAGEVTNTVLLNHQAHLRGTCRQTLIIAEDDLSTTEIIPSANHYASALQSAKYTPDNKILGYFAVSPYNRRVIYSKTYTMHNRKRVA